ncbi:response regulator [Anaeromusa acidaminophila]|uniref:response regulator n=1 Tax=Anaeromusa acidaminophila TaxID=81464 RepID=UPI0003717031|nr:response regulator [Anaeromusa acidaminophila]
MTEKIRVLLVDDNEDTLRNITELLSYHEEIALVGKANTAQEGLAQAAALQPDIVLMDVNMPGMNGIEAAEVMQDQAPNVSIIIMSVQGDQEHLRRAMIAGAKNYLIKPFSSEEVISAIKQVADLERRRRRLLQMPSKGRREGRIITVFSTKGGIGKTLIATNLSVALAEHTGCSTVLVDGYLQFGDAALFLNLMPQATIADLIKDLDQMDEGVIRSYLTPYSSRLSVLAAPHRPEEAESISGAQMAEILTKLKGMFDLVVVDSPPSFADFMLNILDVSDMIIVVSSLDLPTIKNIKMCLEIMDSLGYPREKLLLLLNRANSEGGMTRVEVEDTLKRSFDMVLPSDGVNVLGSVNRGIPLVVGNPDTPIAQAFFQLAQILAYGEVKAPAKKVEGGFMARLKRAFKK